MIAHLYLLRNLLTPYHEKIHYQNCPCQALGTHQLPHAACPLTDRNVICLRDRPADPSVIIGRRCVFLIVIDRKKEQSRFAFCLSPGPAFITSRSQIPPGNALVGGQAFPKTVVHDLKLSRWPLQCST